MHAALEQVIGSRLLVVLELLESLADLRVIERQTQLLNALHHGVHRGCTLIRTAHFVLSTLFVALNK